MLAGLLAYPLLAASQLRVSPRIARGSHFHPDLFYSESGHQHRYGQHRYGKEQKETDLSSLKDLTSL